MTPDKSGPFGLGILPNIRDETVLPGDLSGQTVEDLEDALRALTQQAKWLQTLQRSTFPASNRLHEASSFPPNAVDDLNEKRLEIRERIGDLRREAEEREEEVQEAITAVREELQDRGRNDVVQRVRDDLVE